MGHIHHAIDWTAGAFIVHNKEVLLIWHRKLKTWLCPGGHIELNEDPEQAILREVKEEVGLDIELLGKREEINDERSKALIQPRFLDRHPITADHQHIGLFYLARPLTFEIGGEYAGPNHNNGGDWGWFADFQLEGLTMWPATRYYAATAIKEVSDATGIAG